jgi:hypothetical protein
MFRIRYASLSIGLFLVASVVACGSSEGQEDNGASQGGSSGLGGSSSSSSSSGATSSSGSDGSSSGASSSDGGVARGPECAAGTAPAGVADQTMTFRVLAKGETPSGTGGNPEGRWVVDKVSLLLPSGAGGLVKLDKSNGVAKGWAEFSSGKYKMQLGGHATVTPVIGKAIDRDISIDDNGTFSVAGGTFTFTPHCPVPPETGELPKVEFTVNGSRATFIVEMPTQIGTAFVVLEGPKQ